MAVNVLVAAGLMSPRLPPVGIVVASVSCGSVAPPTENVNGTSTKERAASLVRIWRRPLAKAGWFAPPKLSARSTDAPGATCPCVGEIDAVGRMPSGYAESRISVTS